MAYKFVLVTSTVAGAIEEALSEVALLKEEMEEWKSNMESANMEHLDKYSEVEETWNILEGISEDLDGLDNLPEDLQQASVTFNEGVNKNKRRGPSRSMRCSNSVARLQAAVDRIEEENDKLKGEGEGEGGEGPYAEVIEELESMVSELESIDFPGMF